MIFAFVFHLSLEEMSAVLGKESVKLLQEESSLLHGLIVLLLLGFLVLLVGVRGESFRKHKSYNQ